MSGLVKGIKKVFKKVIAPVLAVGAIVFTGGAALGLPAFAGGWGAAVTKGLGALGLAKGGVVSNVLTGAITKAGTGGAIGGLLSKATGGSFSDGAAKGALTGALVGGVTGLATPTLPTDPAANAATVDKTAIASAQPTTATTAGVLQAPANPQVVAGGVTPASAATAAGPATGTGLFPNGFQNSALGKFVTSPAGGQVIAGLGQGLLGGLAEKDQQEAVLAERQRRIDSYAGSGLAMDWARDRAEEEAAQEAAASDAAAEDLMDREPAWRRFASNNSRKSRWRYDSASGGMVRT